MHVNEIITLLNEAKPKKRIFNDGKIQVTMPDGRIFSFKDESEFLAAEKKYKDKTIKKLKNMKTLRALSRAGLWNVLPAAAVVELIISTKENFFDNPDAWWKDFTQAVIILIIHKVAIGLRAGKFGPRWVRSLADLNKLKKWVAAGGVVGAVWSGGISALSAVIALGGIILIEFLIYHASDQLAEYIVNSVIDMNEFEKEARSDLFDEIAIILGLSVAGKTVSKAGQNKRDADDKLITTVTPLTMQDIDKIKNASAADLKKLRKNPKYASFINKYMGPEKQDIRNLISKPEPEKPGQRLGFESVEENKKQPEKNLSDFINHLEKKYNRSFADKVKRKIEKQI